MRILVLSPHTDDAEFGCGGSIARWVDDGDEVYCLAFSYGTANAEEYCAAMDGLGAMNMMGHVYETRQFLKHRQEILDDLIRFRDGFGPEMVVIPSSSDIHQDHQVVHQEAVRAFKQCTILGYEVPWNQLTSDATMLVSITAAQLQRKIDAVMCYESQAGRAYAQEEVLTALARVRGVQAGTALAEAFEVVRQVW